MRPEDFSDGAWRRRIEQNCFHGKGRAARALDAAAFGGLLFLCGAALLPRNDARFLLAAALAGGGVLLLAFIRRKRLCRYIIKEEKRASMALVRERMLLLSEAELTSLLLQAFGSGDFAILRTTIPADEDALYPVLRGGQTERIFSVSGFTDAALLTAVRDGLRRGTETECRTGEELIKRLPNGMYTHTERDVKIYLSAEYEVARKKAVPRSLPSGGNAALRYLAIGGILLILSLFSRYPLYCRLLASLSFLLALPHMIPLVSHIKNNAQNR